MALFLEEAVSSCRGESERGRERDGSLEWIVRHLKDLELWFLQYVVHGQEDY